MADMEEAHLHLAAEKIVQPVPELRQLMNKNPLWTKKRRWTEPELVPWLLKLKKARVAQGIVRVRVQTMDGDEFSVTMDEEENEVAVLKAVIARRNGAEPWRQVLFMVHSESQLMDEDKITASCTVLLCVRSVEKTWSRTLRTTSGDPRFGLDTVGCSISDDGRTLRGSSALCACLSTQGMREGVGVWTVEIDGSNDVLIGAAAADACLNQMMFINPRMWGMRIYSRRLCMGGEQIERKVGPDDFAAPCTARVMVDCDKGTLAIKITSEIKSVDLGVLCQELPKGEMLHLAAATGTEDCQLRLV